MGADPKGGVKGFHHETLLLLAGDTGCGMSPGLGLGVSAVLGSATALCRVQSTDHLHATAHLRAAMRTHLRSAATRSPGLPDLASGDW